MVISWSRLPAKVEVETFCQSVWWFGFGYCLNHSKLIFKELIISRSLYKFKNLNKTLRSLRPSFSEEKLMSRTSLIFCFISISASYSNKPITVH